MLTRRSDAGKRFIAGQSGILTLRLRTVLDEVIAGAAIDARDREVVIQLTGLADPYIVGARDALVRAFTNVLLNALEATPCGSRVEVRISRENHVALIDICDEGPGIPRELRHKVFQPFFTTRAGCSGLGLTIARAVAQAHGGTVRFLEGPGATLRFELPVQNS
jgi:signal transduction histidine kinase